MFGTPPCLSSLTTLALPPSNARSGRHLLHHPAHAGPVTPSIRHEIAHPVDHPSSAFCTTARCSQPPAACQPWSSGLFSDCLTRPGGLHTLGQRFGRGVVDAVWPVF